MSSSVSSSITYQPSYLQLADISSELYSLLSSWPAIRSISLDLQGDSRDYRYEPISPFLPPPSIPLTNLSLKIHNSTEAVNEIFQILSACQSTLKQLTLAYYRQFNNPYDTQPRLKFDHLVNFTLKVFNFVEEANFGAELSNVPSLVTHLRIERAVELESMVEQNQLGQLSLGLSWTDDNYTDEYEQIVEQLDELHFYLSISPPLFPHLRRINLITQRMYYDVTDKRPIPRFIIRHPLFLSVRSSRSIQVKVSSPRWGEPVGFVPRYRGGDS